MPLITLNSKSIFFIHIPKTGGSSLYSNLKDAGAKISFIRHKSIEKINRQHYHIELLEKHFPSFKKYKCFTIIRDPSSRLLSEYVWRTKDTEFKTLDKWFSTNLGKPYHCLDNHLRPQSDFVCDNVKTFLHKNYCEVEVFLTDFFNKDIDFSKKEKVFEYKRPQLKRHLSKESFNKFKSIYKRDFKVFN
jgi:hypothetical protein